METERYLNVKKSFIISSPAGSGKTEKLARRYIALLDSGAEAERILAITFTEKASSEMKQRILHILSLEKPGLYRKIRPKIPLMRISTIHAFCLRLLKRFSMELGLDPKLDVMDEGVSFDLWKEAVTECLRKESGGPGVFFRAMREKGMDWESLLAHIDELFYKRPLSEMVLRENLDKGEQESRLLEIFLITLKAYKLKKARLRLLDFSDLEIFAYHALLKSPEWQNILYTFDEYTDHILVDEFQDTSALQWRLLDTLTEEWRSGIGAKRDSGITPTIFLVGDEKQSIYFFRGADVSVVKKAKERLSGFLGPEYEYQEIRDNYRSLPQIIEFTNRLFDKIMHGGPEKSWEVSYSRFEAVRKGTGNVELLLLKNDSAGHTKEKRAFEAGILARHIKNLRRSQMVFAEGGGNLRPCDYSDMAVLLRQRTHLSAFEDALRKENIPFIVLKGMGFYEEPEVALLREFISFVVDREDDYSLFCLLRSPLFGLDYDTLSRLVSLKTGTLLEELRSTAGKPGKRVALSAALKILDQLLEKSLEMPLSMLLEDLLVKTSGWVHFREEPRHANVKKFICLIESLEAHGADPVSIRDKLIEERFKNEVPKANVNTEGMDAVKLMTVHAAKGLQFPMVFIPSLDEDTSPRSSAVVIEERGEGFTMRYEPDSARRKGIGEFQRYKEREREEEKRLFYVAITRAMDYLCMSGFDIEASKAKGRLKYIKDSFDLDNPSTLPFELLDAKGILDRFEESPKIELASEVHFLNEPVYTEPLRFEPSLHHRDVTEDILVKTRHGKDWVAIGRAMHQLLEEFSKGFLKGERMEKRAKLIIAGETFDLEKRERFLKIVLADFKKLEESGIFEEVVLPRENSHAEFPFVHQRGKTLYNGRIDRLIIKEREALIYDYKSFPVKKNSELDELMDKYRFQMELYREAVSKLFDLPARAFLVFTHLPLSVEVPGREA